MNILNNGLLEDDIKNNSEAAKKLQDLLNKLEQQLDECTKTLESAIQIVEYNEGEC